MTSIAVNHRSPMPKAARGRCRRLTFADRETAGRRPKPWAPAARGSRGTETGRSEGSGIALLHRVGDDASNRHQGQQDCGLDSVVRDVRVGGAPDALAALIGVHDAQISPRKRTDSGVIA